LVRVSHWINVVCLLVLLMSGLQIFNAHPALYWGEVSDFSGPAFAITAQKVKDNQSRGITVVAGRQLDTTGVLGFSAGNARAFPAWATLPSWQSLAEGRLWHFVFAWVFVINGFVYFLHGLLSWHFWRDLVPSRRDLGRIGHTAWDHLRLRFPAGEEATRYNVLPTRPTPCPNGSARSTTHVPDQDGGVRRRASCPTARRRGGEKPGLADLPRLCPARGASVLGISRPPPLFHPAPVYPLLKLIVDYLHRGECINSADSAEFAGILP
jgi:thiosulfate reductase cytochrome b subunit